MTSISKLAGRAAIVIPLAALPARAADRILRAEMVLEAPVAAVWQAWTTEEGVKSFFAPGCHIDLRVDGAYEIYFAPNNPPGQRGADGMRILALEPEKRFSFTWNAPPSLPNMRQQRTQVILEFEPVGEDRTRLRFTHQGWGEGEEWDAAYEYFDAAWGGQVLPFLAYRFTTGPVNWNARPDVRPLARSLQLGLVPASPAPAR